jgi:hypothetical protein
MNTADLRRAFRRNTDGSWTCVQAIRIDHPRGRIEVTPGTRVARQTRFMGVDLAAWLEEKLGPG